MLHIGFPTLSVQVVEHGTPRSASNAPARTRLPMSNARHSSTVSLSVQRLRPIGNFTLRIPKAFELLDWDHVQEKTRGMHQSGYSAQKVPGRVVASSMRNDAPGVALHGRPTCRANPSLEGPDAH